jgi:hypothetical protein
MRALLNVAIVSRVPHRDTFGPWLEALAQRDLRRWVEPVGDGLTAASIEPGHGLYPQEKVHKYPNKIARILPTSPYVIVTLRCCS